MVRLERTGQDKTTFTGDIQCCVLCRGQRRTAVDSRQEQLSEFSGEVEEWSRLGQLLHGSVTQVLFARVLQVRERKILSGQTTATKERAREWKCTLADSRETRYPSLTHEGTLSLLLKWLTLNLCVCLFLLLHLRTCSFTCFTLTFD